MPVTPAAVVAEGDTPGGSSAAPKLRRAKPPHPGAAPRTETRPPPARAPPRGPGPTAPARPLLAARPRPCPRSRPGGVASQTFSSEPSMATGPALPPRPLHAGSADGAARGGPRSRAHLGNRPAPRRTHHRAAAAGGCAAGTLRTARRGRGRPLAPRTA